MEVITKSAQETYQLGQDLGNKLKGGEILALEGDLGSGKTTFAQGLAKGLGINQQIISPTFIIVREYPTRLGRNFYHIDLYRLEENIENEFKNLGISDLAGRDNNILAIEWAQKAKTLLPENAIWIKFKEIGENKRKINYPAGKFVSQAGYSARKITIKQ